MDIGAYIAGYTNYLFVPAIIISAVLSVLMADMHREIKGDFNFFEKRLGKSTGAFLDRCSEYIVSFITALIVLIIIISIIATIVSLIGKLIKIL